MPKNNLNKLLKKLTGVISLENKNYILKKWACINNNNLKKVTRFSLSNLDS